jgi:tartronate-semialdehyde synthase
VERVAHLRATLPRRDDFDDVPLKPRRVFREINRSFRPDTTFLTASGLYQIWPGQFQQTFEPRRYLVCGQAGPLDWEVPAAIGVKRAFPDKQVVTVAGDNSFQFLMEEIAVSPRPSWCRWPTEAAAGTERPPRPAGPARGPFCMLRPRSTDARRP